MDSVVKYVKYAATLVSNSLPDEERRKEIFETVCTNSKKAFLFSKKTATSFFFWVAVSSFKLIDYLASFNSNKGGFEVCSAIVFTDVGHAVELTKGDAEFVAGLESGSDWWDAESMKWMLDGLHLDEYEESERGWRVEIRYKIDGSKFRAIARPGEPFPTIVEDAKFSAPRVLKVYLEHAESGDKVDITKRYLKFAGPSGDWHGSSVKVYDLFPNNDNESCADDGYDIVVIDNRLKTKRFAFSGHVVISE